MKSKCRIFQLDYCFIIAKILYQNFIVNKRNICKNIYFVEMCSKIFQLFTFN